MLGVSMCPSLRAAGISGAAAAVGLSILLLVSPGYLLFPTGWSETVPLASLPCPSSGTINLTAVGTFLFHTVTFRFYFQGICHLRGTLNWTGTESGGRIYSSEFSYGAGPPPPVLSWTSPDGKFSVQQVMYPPYPPNNIVTLIVYA